MTKEAQKAFFEKHQKALNREDKQAAIQVKNEVMNGILHGLKEDEIELYLRDELDPMQMQTIRTALEEGIPLEYIKDSLLPVKTPEGMVAAKIQYYRQEVSTEGAIPDVYIKGVELTLEQLRNQIRQSECFFRDVFQAKVRETEEMSRRHGQQLEDLRGQCQNFREQSEQYAGEAKEWKERFLQERNSPGPKKELPANMEAPARESAGKVEGGSDLSKRKGLRAWLKARKEAKTTQDIGWLIDLLCRPDLGLSQAEELRRAYQGGLSQNEVEKIAKSGIDGERLEGMVDLLLELHGLPPKPEGNCEGGEGEGGED